MADPFRMLFISGTLGRPLMHSLELNNPGTITSSLKNKFESLHNVTTKG